jgi:YesN/AraC family two-component response regulator
MNCNKKRILFVDDEPSVLAGLRNVFRKDRERWDMMFANGGTEALTLLAQHTFDVVVSDMRMPEIDGAALFERVKRESPQTIRIMLSGSADKEEVDRATASVDELLGKPCDTKTLRMTIERLMGSRVV